MKIGIFTDAYVPQIGGVSTSCLLLKNELTKRGHKVFVFTTSDPAAPLEEHGVIRVPSLPFVSSKRVAVNYNPMLIGRVRKLELDLIHTQTEFGLGIFGRSICRQTGIPHVHTYHTLYEDWLHGQLKKGPIDLIARNGARRLSATFCNSAQHIIVPTIKTRKLLLSYGVTKPIDIIPTGIELEKFFQAKQDAAAISRVKEELGIKPEDKVLLYLGRISDEKSITQLFDYLEPWLKVHREARFILVGEGPLRGELMRFVEQHKLLGQVIFTGGVALAAVPHLYAIADVFMSASRSETQGLTYIEALATAVPILVRRDEALEGVVEEGRNGCYFDDRESFVAALDRILEQDESSYAQMSKQALASSEKYSVEAFATSVEALYARQIEKGGRFGKREVT